MKSILVFIITLISINLCNSQNKVVDYKTYKFKYVGEVNNQPIFRYLKKNALDKNVKNNGAIPGALYWIKVANQYLVEFDEFKKIESELGNVNFINNEIQISNLFTNNESYKLCVIIGKDTLILDTKLSGGFSSRFSFSRDNLIFFSGFSQDHHIRIIDYSKERIEIKTLPLLGFTPKVLGRYLYFDYHHIDENKVTPCPVDLYRVKIGDWNSPELIAEFISDAWLPLNDSIVLMRVPVKGWGKQVFYNINNKTYIETDKTSTKLIKYEGEEYLLAIDKNNEGDKKYVLKSLPYIQTDGFINDNQREIFPRVLQVNLSNDQKPFANTFISEELLYEASDEKLKELSENELRILRNSFFARYGYQFKSEDLQDFFDQFEWYNQLVESNNFFEISNEEIVISPKDKERVELILEIEKSK